jgi:HEAT repeat protein
MGLFRNGKPNIKTLVRRGDADGLVEAAGFQDLMSVPDRGVVDGGVQVRQEAILALGRMGPEVGAEAVAAALSDHSDHVRVAAIQVLYSRQEATLLATALAWLPRERGHSRRTAMKALAALGHPDTASVLAAALVHGHGEDPVDEDEARLLRLLLDADEGSDAACDVVEQLLVALADERDVVTERAEDLLVGLAPVSIEGVIAELKAGAAPHRAAVVLARIKDTRALEPLMESLLHRDARVRAESATALGELRDPAAVEALIQATRDPDHRVRARAGSALDQLGMVALMVGVSTLVRPMLLEAIADAERRPALPEATDVAAATDGAGVERAAGGAAGAAAKRAAEAENGATPDHSKEGVNGATTDEPPEPATADLLERLFPGADNVPDAEGERL